MIIKITRTKSGSEVRFRKGFNKTPERIWREGSKVAGGGGGGGCVVVGVYSFL